MLITDTSLVGVQALGSASVSDLSNTADFATVSTFETIDPTLLLTQSLTSYTTLTSGTITVTDSTTTVEITVTQVPASEATSAMVTDSPITESSAAVETASPVSSTTVTTETNDSSSVWVSEVEFTSVWKSRVTYSRAGNRTSSTTCTASSQDAATTTSDVDGVSATASPEFNSPVSTFSLITGTAGTTGFPSSTNGTWTAPVATSTFNASAINMKMAGANIIGAAAVALAANLI